MTPPKYIGQKNERYAIWFAHNGFCCYCAKHYEFRDCEIDHIIPQGLSRYECRAELLDILNRISTKFQLPKDFAIDTFYNVLLSCRSCNNQKGSKVLDDTESICHFKQARDVYDKVVKKYDYINRERTKNEIAAIVSSSLKRGTITGDDIDDIKLIACDKFNHHVLVEMDAWEETSLITLGISGDVDDIDGFEKTFDWYKDNKIKAPNKDKNATLYLMSTMKQQMYNQQYLYTGIIDRSNGNLLMLPGKPPEIQLLLPPAI